MFVYVWLQYKAGENINFEDYLEDDDDDEEDNNNDRFDDDFKISAADRRAASALGVINNSDASKNETGSKKMEVEGQEGGARSTKPSRKEVNSKQELEDVAGATGSGYGNGAGVGGGRSKRLKKNNDDDDGDYNADEEN